MFPSHDRLGGTKLQEIVGATKEPLARAIKAQQLKDLQRKKLITSLISKTKPNETRKLFEALKNETNPKTGKPLLIVTGKNFQKMQKKCGVTRSQS